MENASKALLIAAALLIAILVIVFTVRIITPSLEVKKQVSDTSDTLASANDKATESLAFQNLKASGASLEGRYVKFDGRLWLIIIDNNTNGLFMVNEGSLGDCTLGYNQENVPNDADADNNGTTTDIEKAKWSYDNAIDTLNSACREALKENGKYKSKYITDVSCINREQHDKLEEFYKKGINLYTGEYWVAWKYERVISKKTYYTIKYKYSGNLSMDALYYSDYSDMMEKVSFWTPTTGYSLGGTKYIGIHGLKAVVKLSPSVMFSGGNGSKTNPYILSE